MTAVLLASMGKADLHIHTTYSYDSACSVPAALEWAANYTDLDIIAITDHDTFDGALKAMELAPRFGMQVIPGCEITTRDGHLLGLFMSRAVPSGLSMLETVLKVGEQGGLCVAAHPMARLVHGVSEETIRSILADPDAGSILVGMETWNTGVFLQGSNERTQRLNENLKISSTGGSDSHVVWTIGFGYTEFPGRRPEDLRLALLNRTTQANKSIARRSPMYWPNHVFSRLLREMGWAKWAAEPNAPLTWRRLADVQSAL